MQKLMIRHVKEQDFEQLTEIYNHYILNSIATFEEELIETNEMASRIN